MTALHKDNYENIYCQIIGQKHFVLLPPVAHACVGERVLHQANYVRHNGDLVIEKEQEQNPIPFPTWDPDGAGISLTNYSYLARPLRTTLDSGDILYLPALCK